VSAEDHVPLMWADDEGPEDDQVFYMPGAWTVMEERPEAIRVVGGEGATHWVPKSQLTPFSECQKAGDSGVLAVTDWLAHVRGWDSAPTGGQP
jgi:hypothetical protein